MAIKSRANAYGQVAARHSRSANVVPLRLYDMHTAPSVTQWAQTVELILAIEPDPSLAMAWFVGEQIMELDGFTGYELLKRGEKPLLDKFLSDIMEGRRG